MTSARVVADSIYDGKRLTTLEVVMHRWVLAEFNTHRVFSRNSASSRAIPFKKQVAKVLDYPALPIVWATEQKGMSGGEPLSPSAESEAIDVWLTARDHAVLAATSLAALGVHKSIINRLLEPFLFQTVVVTSTAWDNFFEQRCNPAAQPEIRVAAEAMRTAMEESTPNVLDIGEWHLPYVEGVESHLDSSFLWPDAHKISAARCARVSYLTQNGERDPMEDLNLYNRLTSAQPPHWSPLEHVATPDITGKAHGNLSGWESLRSMVEDQMGLDMAS